jgi:GNAT superfamily N-acetyltransferase
MSPETPLAHSTSTPQVAIRPAVRADADGLRRFLAGLSATTSYRRFCMGLGPVPERLLALLLRRDRGQEVLLAVHDGEIVGHAMYGAVPGRAGTGELAVVVTDAWQRRGLGSRLVRTLLAAAARHDVREMGFSILADNRPAQRFVSTSWPQARPVFADGMYEYSLPLATPIAA